MKTFSLKENKYFKTTGEIHIFINCFLMEIIVFNSEINMFKLGNPRIKIKVKYTVKLYNI